MAKQPAYESVANDLRAAIHDGTYPPGSTLPRLEDLMAKHRVGTGTARKAIAILADEGLVEAIRRRGTVVRAAPVRNVIVRERKIFRDEHGYFFDLTAQTWVAIQKPTVRKDPPPADIADILGTVPGQKVVIRDRVMGDPDTKQPRHVSLSYLPPWLVDELPVIAAVDTGPGGIYDRMEEHLQGQLVMDERIGVRPPSGRERELWTMAPGTAMLRLLRIVSSPTGQVCEINETAMPGDRNEIGYALERADPGAADR